MKNRSTGRLGRLFLNAVILESRSPGSVVAKIRNTTDAGTLRAARHSSMTLCGERRCGFTLIELLVVVLIIGILAAVALPQYRVAVERARVAKALPVLRSIVDARERSFMANGVYSANLEDLDIKISYQSKKELSDDSGTPGIQYFGTPIGFFKLPSRDPCVFWGAENLVIDFCSSYKICYGANDMGDRICASFGRKTERKSHSGRDVYSLDF